MTEQTFVEAYRSSLQRKIAQLSDATGHGSAKSFEDYRRKCGRVEGLEDALTEFNATIKNYIEETDEE